MILGSCPPCPRVSRQKCVCGKQVAERSCASPLWHCDRVSIYVFWGVGIKELEMRIRFSWLKIEKE